MKMTRKIITLALAMLLALALVIPAFAETQVGGTIEITGDAESATIYTVYKMFDVADGKVAEENKYKATEEWVSFVTQESLKPFFIVQKTNEGTYMIWRKDTASTADAAAIAELARGYLETADGADAKKDTKVGEIAVNADEALPVATNGYYLLVPNNDTASGVIVVKNGQNKSITEKSVAPGMPLVEKKVWEDSTQSYVDLNTVDVGQEIEYKVTIIAGQGASYYVMHDAMDEHIEFIPKTVAINRGGNPVAKDVEYWVITDENEICSDCTFHIKFNPEWCAGLNEGAVLTVTYKGVLKAKTGDVETETDIAHENTAWLTHTTQNVKTDPDSVGTKTFEINIKKVDQDKVALAGAGFKLRDNEHKFYKYDETTGKISWVDEADATVLTSAEGTGMLRFFGLDAEIFYLKEVIVPGGYTGAGETQINVKNGSIKAGNTVEEIEVVNNLGQKLPETGGIGTTVFYVLGGVLLVGALVVLAVMKRKESSAQ